MAKRGVNVVVKPLVAGDVPHHFVETAIARALTGDIFRADDRAMQSVNRADLFAQQVALADKIRSIRPRAVFAPPAMIDHPVK